MTEGTSDVRPFQVGTVFNDAMVLFFRNFFAIQTVVIVLFIPVLIHVHLQIQEIREMGPALFAEDADQPEWIIQAIETFLLRPMAAVIITVALFHALIGKPMSFIRSTQIALRRLPAAVGVLILKTLVTMLPVALLVIPLVVMADGRGNPLAGLVLIVVVVIVAILAAIIHSRTSLQSP